MKKHIRTAAFGASAMLLLATGLTGIVLDLVFILLAVALAAGALKYLK